MTKPARSASTVSEAAAESARRVTPMKLPVRVPARSASRVSEMAAESARRVTPMKLLVRVVEARGLPAVHLNGSSDPFVKLKLGKRRAKTAVVKRSLAPAWDEEFSFLVADVAEELVVSVLNEDKYFSNDLLGQVRVQLSQVMETDDLSLGTQWYQLQPKSKKSKKKCRGEVCLHVSLSTRTHVSDESQSVPRPASDDLASSSDSPIEHKTLSTTCSCIDLSAVSSIEQASHSSFERFPDNILELPARSSVEEATPEPGPAAADTDAMPNPSSVVEVLSRYFFRKPENATVQHSIASDTDQPVDHQLQEPNVSSSEDREIPEKGTVPESSLDELLKVMESKDQGSEMPTNLPGGVLVDESYVAAPNELNSLLFSPNSDFWPVVAELQGTSGFQIEPWKLDSNESCVQRSLTYTKAASKLVKAVKATEEQKYLKAAGNSYAVFSIISTPDVPCGNCFKVEILYCITPGPQLSSEEQTCHLTVSWRVNFVQSTMIKGMIENGAKQGMTEGYAQFSEVLSQKLKVAELDDANSNKEKILASLHAQKETCWRLIVRFLGNFTFIFSVAIALYVIAHLHLSKPDVMHGLEYFGLDLPDSIGEVVVCAVLILQGQSIVKVTRRFLSAWKQRGSDHGVKAHGDGWLLTVALIEGTGITATGSSDLFDIYVVFTCNAKRKTSSIKFQTSDPKWNEIFEFDAMDDPPSRMDVAIYDSSEQCVIGHTEVNFLKNNLSELTDIWLPLNGKCDQASNPKLHLRIFLNNSRGTEVVMNYLAKMGKEVGKKINLRSAQTNVAFRKLFALPLEEFLIDDFTCHLKRKMPLQGRLFFSPRIVGFYSNIFGHKTKFFFLWEDVDDIQVIPATLSIGSPSLMIILRKDRGLEAKHGAKGTDHHGRLKFNFQSFVSFNDAYRIITAIWKIRALGPEQKGEAIEKDEVKELLHEEGGSLFTNADVKMSEIFSSVLCVDVESLMEMFSGGPLEHKMMQKAGCIDYTTTQWELVGCNIQQRQTSYKFDKNLSRYGGEATTTEQKYSLVNQDGWVIEKVMTIQGVLLADYFNLQMKYYITNIPSKPNTCSMLVLLGIAWLKSTKQQKKVTKNIISNTSNGLKELFTEVEKELTSRNDSLLNAATGPTTA